MEKTINRFYKTNDYFSKTHFTSKKAAVNAAFCLIVTKSKE